MPRKPGLNSEFVMFDVLYEDGTQRSNRKVPRALTGGLDGDKPAHGFLIEQDRDIAAKSGKAAGQDQKHHPFGRQEEGARLVLGAHRLICVPSCPLPQGRANKMEPPMPQIQILNPDSLGKPLGQYSQLTRVKASEFLFFAGQVGADKNGKAAGDFDAQCGLAFANIGAALSSQGASFGNIVEFTTYLVHAQDIAKFMAYRTREFPKLFKGGAYPPNTLLVIDRLVREEFLIEVSAVAAL